MSGCSPKAGVARSNRAGATNLKPLSRKESGTTELPSRVLVSAPGLSGGIRFARSIGLGLHTPASVHFGTARAIRASRAEVLTAAYTRNPDRFSRRPEPPKLPTVACRPPDEHTRLQSN
jgi:hypothetical protein